jgi:selenocysteine lyase/cysteine desulfurase
LAGYLSVAEPEDGWGTYFGTPLISPVGNFAYVKTARRWENGGTANYPGAIGLAEGVGLLNEIGIDNIGEHLLSLTGHLIAALQAANIRVVTPEDRRYRSGIVTFSLDSPGENTALIDFLKDRKVLVSLRYTSDVGGVRVGCHLFNNTADLDRLVEETASFVRQGGKARA